MTLPFEPSACTSNHVRVPVMAIGVSKFLAALRLTVRLRCVFENPDSTRQAANLVAPFQLAYTVVLPLLLRTAPLGGYSGSPTHPCRSTR
jgi:hypothetical protein